ncbi:MAG: GTP-binding protein, partial [Actinomycetota bacterium]
MSDPGADLLDGFRTVTALLGASRPDAATRPAGAADDGQRCPVTVLTGVLGSGKTTVLRRLLEADHGLAITAVVNDLGAVNIDAALLADATPRSGSGPPPRLELTNGCACCSAADDLRAALREVRGATPPPDAIVIEASGAADAVAVAATVEGDDALALDGVVAVIDVDAAAGQLGHPSLGPLLRRQLATAHLVLLAKIDLVSTEQLDHVHDLVAGLAPGRMLLPIADGRVDPGVLL